MKQLLVFLFTFTLLPPLFAANLKPYKGGLSDISFQLTDSGGRQHDLKSYRGNVVLINFWATWCPPCIEELPSLQRLQKHFEGQNVSILTIDVGESVDIVKPFLKKANAEALHVLMDTDARIHKQWNIYVFPTTFLLDKAGKIQYGAVGALQWDNPRVIDIINKLKDKH